MANLTELLRLGPFTGIDLTTANEFTPPGQAQTALNANPTRVNGALMCEKGRVELYDFSAYLQSISVVVECICLAGEAPFYIVGGPAVGSGTFETYITQSDISPPQLIPGAVEFDQAIQFGQVVYTNGGQRFFTITLITGGLQWYLWQYPPPPSSGGGVVTLGQATGGNMSQQTYYYLFTRYTVMPDGTISETSVNLADYAAPISITLTGSNSEVTLTAAASFWNGTNADGTTFSTNIYRLSTNQPEYLNLGAGGEPPGTTLVVDAESDAQIASNPSLVPQRDQPPTVFGSYGQTAYNYGALAIHKGLIWVFLVVQDASTNGVPQVQLWYSNLGRGWEFNQLTQVLLLTSDVVAQYANGQAAYYNDAYGNDPVAVAEVGSILCALQRRLIWGVYGDDPTTFIARPILNFGAQSRHAVTPAVGGIFFPSENGAYFFDGGAPQYDSQDIRNGLRSIGSPGPSPTDMVNSCGSFSQMTWYLSFPTLGYTYGYDTISGKWTSKLPYAPATTSGITSIPAHPAALGYNDLNEVVVARAGAAILDWWFADPNDDLGAPQTCTWTGPLCDASTAQRDLTAFLKEFNYLTLLAPVQPGLATVTLAIDPGALNAQSISATFDLSCTGAGSFALDLTPFHRWFLDNANGATVRGFLAQISVTLTGIAGQPAPQVWKVGAWGTPLAPLVGR